MMNKVMMIKQRPGFFMVAICLLLSITLASCDRAISLDEKSVANRDVLLDVPSENYIMLSGAAVTVEGQSAQFKADLSETVADVTFMIKRGSPNMTDVLVVIGDLAYNLAYDLEADKGFDGYGNLLTGYYMQLTAFDLDKDGKKEVIVSVGDMGNNISNTVFKLTGKTDRPGESPFKKTSSNSACPING